MTKPEWIRAVEDDIYSPHRYTYQQISLAGVMRIVRSGLSMNEVIVLLFLQSELDEYNMEFGYPEKLWVNAVYGISINDIGSKCQLEPTAVLDAINKLNRKGILETSWLEGMDENQTPGLCHVHRLKSPTEQEIAAHNLEVKRRRDAEEREADKQREKRRLDKQRREMAKTASS